MTLTPNVDIYARNIGGKLFHYRNGRDREIDAVVETQDGKWCAIEIRLGANQIDSATRNLLKIKELFDSEGKGPSSLCVTCGMATYSYIRPDGVSVVPLTALKP